MRSRMASLLAVLWAGVQAHDLVLVGGPPSTHVIGWSLCLIALLLAVLLLTGRNWARLMALVAGLGMLSVYGWISLRYDIPRLSAWLQPVLDIALVVTLVKPPSNKAPADAAKRRC
jgi:hypothetical protein